GCRWEPPSTWAERRPARGGLGVGLANHPVMAEDRPEAAIAPAWTASLASFERELMTRGASPNTLRAYRNDLRELAEWASTRDREPGRLAYRDLRAYAAALSERGLARSSVARKL